MCGGLRIVRRATNDVSRIQHNRMAGLLVKRLIVYIFIKAWRGT
jgi:hypothetical protein